MKVALQTLSRAIQPITPKGDTPISTRCSQNAHTPQATTPTTTVIAVAPAVRRYRQNRRQIPRSAGASDRPTCWPDQA